MNKNTENIKGDNNVSQDYSGSLTPASTVIMFNGASGNEEALERARQNPRFVYGHATQRRHGEYTQRLYDAHRERREHVKDFIRRHEYESYKEAINDMYGKKYAEKHNLYSF